MQSPEHDIQEGRVHARADRGEPGDPGAANLASQLGNAAVRRIVGAPGVQRAGATGAQQLDESVARAIEDRRGRGTPLSEPVRQEMEGALGQDLTDVRVHTDHTAHELNEAVSARAFTAGSDVFFKQGTYDPSSSSGRELLGHELTHVVQQRTGASGLQPGEVSHPSDVAEQHAETVGQRIAGATPAVPAPANGPPAAVSRQADTEDEVQMSPEPGSAVARQAEEPEEQPE